MTFSKFLKNPFKYILLISQLMSLLEGFYQYVSALDDDPEVQGVWETLKSNPVIATRVGMARMQIEGIKEVVKQLKK